MSLGCLLLGSCGDVFKDELNRYAEARGAVLVKFSHCHIDDYGNWDFRFPSFVLW